MPEDLTLPGIDPAPAAPASPASSAAPQTGDDSAAPTQSASVDTTGDAQASQPVTDAPVETPEQREQRRGRDGASKRIDELVGQTKEAKQTIAQLTGLLELVLRGTMSPAQAQAKAGVETEPPPKEADFKDWKEFETANAKYWARQEVRQELAQQAERERVNRQQFDEQRSAHQRAAAEEQLHTIAGAQMHEAAKRYPDYMDVIASCPVLFPVNLEAAMAQTGSAGDVAYYLAKNPRVAVQLAQMPDLQIAHHVTRIANFLRSQSASVSNAPDPGQPAGNRSVAILAYPKDATPEQHLAWEAQNKRRQKRA